MTNQSGQQFQNGIKHSWTTIDNNIFDDEENFKGWEKPVFMALMRYSFGLGGEARPSQTTIAKKFGISRKTVNEVMGRLEEKGFLERCGLHSKTKTVIWRTRIPEEIDVIYKQNDLDRAKKRLAYKGQATDEIFLPDQAPEPAKEPTPAAKEKKPRKPKEVDNIPYEEIIGYLNQKAGRNFDHETETYRKAIRKYWGKYSLQDFKTVIDNQVADWTPGKYFSSGKEAATYLKPTTLFGPKFDEYLNNTPQQPQQKTYGHVKPLEEASPFGEVDGISYDLRIPEQADAYENAKRAANKRKRELMAQ